MGQLPGETLVQVQAILSGKGQSLITVSEDVKLAEVATTLAKHKIGAVVVRSETGGVAGILSERDIIGAIAQAGAASLDQTASNVMTRDVITCRPTDDVDVLMEKMTRGRFRHMPVVDGEALAGIVSIGDVVKHHVAEVEMEASALKTYLVAG
ncbi:MAG: CBS domain-containing protein [Pseudomonadota bacterium]